MKITKSTLQRIIKEEIDKYINEGPIDPLGRRITIPGKKMRPLLPWHRDRREVGKAAKQVGRKGEKSPSFYDDPKGARYEKYVKWLSNQTRKLNKAYTKLSMEVDKYEKLAIADPKALVPREVRMELLDLADDGISMHKQAKRVLDQSHDMNVAGTQKYERVILKFLNGLIKLVKRLQYLHINLKPFPRL